MNNWWKAGLLGLGGAGLLAASGGTLAAPLAGILGDGAAAGGTAAAGTDAVATAAAGTGAATTGATATSAGMLPGATAFETAPIIPGGVAPVSGALSGTSMDYGTAAGLADANAAAAAAPPPPGLLSQAGHYAGMAGKAASAYGSVNNAMAANQRPVQAPQGRPIFQGDAPQISQPMQGMLAPPQNAFAQQLLAQRQRGMLG